MKAIKYEKDAVLIQDKKIKAWVDIWIENEDVICDWNQNIFDLTYLDQVALKKWQDNLNHFEQATIIALEVLEKFEIIYQDNNAKWHQTEKYFTTKGSIDIL